jgi:protein-tyrosine kinase
MSTFFKALERAEEERALRRPLPVSAPMPEPSPTPSGEPSAVDRAPESVFKAPRSVPATPERPRGLEEIARRVEDHLVSLLAPTSFEAEQYRALRHIVEQLNRSAHLSVIAISSPDAGDGKTTTAINLAGALAQAPDARILLVDADLRGANIAFHLGLGDETPGLVDAIVDTNLAPETAIQFHPHLNLAVLTAGRRPTAPYEVLESPRVIDLLAWARQKFDFVIVDTPPLVSVPDGRVIAKLVDGFLIVVAAHRTPRKLLEETLNLMEPAKIVGLVFNGDDRHVSRGSHSSRRRVVRGARRRQTASAQ